MVKVSNLNHLRLLCGLAKIKKAKPSTTELLLRFDAMQQPDQAPSLSNPQSVSQKLVDDKADDTCIINSLQNFLSQSYILENNGVLITHLLEKWERPLKPELLFKGDGRNRLFQSFCKKHPSYFEVFNWLDENDSVRGVLTTEAPQLRVAKQIVYEDSVQTRPSGYVAATPSFDPLLLRPTTPPRMIRSPGCSRGREKLPRPPLPPPMLPGLPPPPMPPQRHVLPTPPAMPVSCAFKARIPPVMPPLCHQSV
jgi:hypothetical protein